VTNFIWQQTLALYISKANLADNTLNYKKHRTP